MHTLCSIEHVMRGLSISHQAQSLAILVLSYSVAYSALYASISFMLNFPLHTSTHVVCMCVCVCACQYTN